MTPSIASRYSVPTSTSCTEGGARKALASAGKVVPLRTPSDSPARRPPRICGTLTRPRANLMLLRVLLLLFLPALLGHPGDYIRPLAPPPALAQVGIASWYGPWHEGRLTANGEVFRMAWLTAAHRTWPFGSLVRVTSLRTGRVVVVRLNDRGPFVGGRVIDLSRAAAGALGVVERGVESVKLELLSD